MSASILGINPVQVDTIPAFKLGTIGGLDDPVDGYKEFIYGQAEANAVAAGLVCVEGPGGVWTRITTANSAAGQLGGHGSRVGAAAGSLGANQYGWFQVAGKGTINTLASCALGTRLNTTATAGALDDDGTAASRAINGIVLKTATGGAQANNSDARFFYPTVGVTL